MDLKFIREDFPHKADSDELNDIVGLLHKNVAKEKEAKIGERFLRALFLGYKTLHQKSEEKLRQKAISTEKVQRLIRPIAHQTIKQQIPDIRNEPTLKTPTPIKTPEKSLESSYTLLLSDKKVLARAVISKEIGKYHYKLIEPSINMNMLKLVKEYIIKKYKKDKEVLKDDKLILKRIKKASRKTKMGYKEEVLQDVKYYLYRDLDNFSKIDPLFHDHNLNSIICEGVNKPILVDYQNERMETNVIFSNNEGLNSLINKFAEKTNTEINSSNPILNVRYNEFRIQANLGSGVVSSRFIIKRELNI
ncbi:MAG: hypothetical protein QGF74_00200 [Candidatus Nanoarchaeia archaeon]|jgi:hypothetical protein|nr:hypothetical protein [Candidatus Nanoarchaeia archaeon]|tara:strand:+ start:79431 stop:80345 length:915 start_codon:yes stop_codon:yes gene_type:complete